jgi:hypothetical protein
LPADFPVHPGTSFALPGWPTRPVRGANEVIPMPQNRLKHFPTAVIRRGLAHFHPALPMPGYLPPRIAGAGVDYPPDAGGPRASTTVPLGVLPLPDPVDSPAAGAGASTS